MATLELTSSTYRVVPIAPVESEGASVVSLCPAQFRTRLGASGTVGAVGAAADARAARRAAAAFARWRGPGGWHAAPAQARAARPGGGHRPRRRPSRPMPLARPARALPGA